MMNDIDNKTKAGKDFTPFLQLVADDLFEQYGNDMSQVTIVAPNKRANLFFNQYLSKHITDKPIWTPQFTTIGEVFEMLCPFRIADPIQQICTLYEAYRNISKTEESLDKFYSWAELMKNDFDDIDNNLANAEMLFANIKDLEQMKDFSFLSESQKEAIRRYFDDFNIGSESKLKERFLGVWRHMYDTYIEYQKLLSSKHLCYSGMQKRMVVEGVKNGTIDIDSHLNKGVYVILGFNVLNETEKMLFKCIQSSRTTLFYWDYDEKYLNSEAGRFVSQNIKLFGNHFAGHPEYYRHFGTQESIRFIKSPTENAQTRFVSQWFDNNVTKHPLQESVVVLCNEDVLLPVLHAIPSEYDDEKTKMNVTMGYPLAETPIYSYVHALMDVQMHGYRGNNVWKYNQASIVLKHPYTKRMIGDKALHILSALKKNNIIFPNTKQLTIVDEEEDDFLKMIFSPVDNHTDLIDYLITIVKSIGKSYKKQLKEMKDAKETNFELQLYVESIFTTYSILSRIRTIQEREPVFNVNNSTLSRLLYQMLQQKSIPFHGEPAVGLQVMGLLETRNLDFRNVLMLSVNEGKLPKQEKMASLIPYALRDAYGMTTIEKQVSLYAFYFYNLLQRAENVTLMYNSSTDGISTGEMSRFMMQMQLKSRNLFTSPKAIELLSLTAPNISHEVTPVEIKKTDEVMEKLKKLNYLSPSVINKYIDCPLQFYLSKVAEFTEDDELTEGVDSSMFGTIFHKAMELIYTEYIGRLVTAEDLQTLINKKNCITDYVDKAFSIEFFHMPDNLETYHPNYNGEQLLNKYVIIDYVKNQLKYDMQSCPMTILGVEKKMKIPFELNDGSTILIGGIIDRYERVRINGQNVIRISDYKTNAKAQKTVTLEDTFDSTKSGRAYNFLQALYYCEVFTRHENPKEPVSPALMYIKTALSSRDCRLLIEKEYVDDYETYRSRYCELLRDKISEIFDPDVSFTQNDSHCEFCEFHNYCKK